MKVESQFSNVFLIHLNDGSIFEVYAEEHDKKNSIRITCLNKEKIERTNTMTMLHSTSNDYDNSEEIEVTSISFKSHRPIKEYYRDKKVIE